MLSALTHTSRDCNWWSMIPWKLVTSISCQRNLHSLQMKCARCYSQQIANQKMDLTLQEMIQSKTDCMSSGDNMPSRFLLVSTGGAPNESFLQGYVIARICITNRLQSGWLPHKGGKWQLQSWSDCSARVPRLQSLIAIPPSPPPPTHTHKVGCARNGQAKQHTYTLKVGCARNGQAKHTYIHTHTHTWSGVRSSFW
jgi:hypothetical protein